MFIVLLVSWLAGFTVGLWELEGCNNFVTFRYDFAITLWCASFRFVGFCCVFVLMVWVRSFGFLDLVVCVCLSCVDCVVCMVCFLLFTFSGWFFV